MKFIFLVEGYTEQKTIPAFLKRWLDARLTQRVGIQVDRFDGWSELVADLPKKVPMYLHGPKAEDIIAVAALLDLYGPTFYPEHLTPARERQAWAVEELQRRVAEARFRMFFAVHEVEAWLLSNPTLFPEPVTRALPGKIRQPETVNFDEPPAALLEKLYRERQRRHYKKVTNGSALFPQLSPDLVYEKCPYFRQMMDELLTLAKEAGL